MRPDSRHCEIEFFRRPHPQPSNLSKYRWGGRRTAPRSAMTPNGSNETALARPMLNQRCVDQVIELSRSGVGFDLPVPCQGIEFREPRTETRQIFRLQIPDPAFDLLYFAHSRLHHFVDMKIVRWPRFRSNAEVEQIDRGSRRIQRPAKLHGQVRRPPLAAAATPRRRAARKRGQVHIFWFVSGICG